MDYEPPKSKEYLSQKQDDTPVPNKQDSPKESSHSALDEPKEAPNSPSTAKIFPKVSNVFNWLTCNRSFFQRSPYIHNHSK